MANYESPLSLNDLPFNYLNNYSIPNQAWGIIEKMKQEFEKKIDKLSDENDGLKKDIKKLENEKNKLEADKEELVNDVQDLRALLKRVHEEGEIQIEKLMKKNKETNEKANAYKNSLDCLAVHGKHFDDISCYWQEYLSI